MSSRLFDRVREQRGLCYSISASTHSLRDRGAVFGYAGTTPERAQETLDVTLRENAIDRRWDRTGRVGAIEGSCSKLIDHGTGVVYFGGLIDVIGLVPSRSHCDSA